MLLRSGLMASEEILRYLVKGLKASSHDKLLIKFRRSRLAIKCKLVYVNVVVHIGLSSFCQNPGQKSEFVSIITNFFNTSFFRKLLFDIETCQSRVALFQPPRTRALFTWFLTSLHKMALDRKEKVERKIGDPSVTIDKFCRQHVLQLLLRVPSRVCRILVYLHWAPSDFISLGNNAPFTQY